MVVGQTMRHTCIKSQSTNLDYEEHTPGLQMWSDVAGVPLGLVLHGVMTRHALVRADVLSWDPRQVPFLLYMKLRQGLRPPS